MHRHLLVPLLAYAAAVVACTAAEPGNDDAAGADAAGIGRCVPDLLTATCVYRDYGIPCPVPCDLPGTCTYSVAVTWTGPYCCISNVEHFQDCFCDHGTTLCPQRPGVPEMPFSTCEFCHRPDAGVGVAPDDDAAVDDASTGEPDAAIEG